MLKNSTRRQKPMTKKSVPRSSHFSSIAILLLSAAALASQGTSERIRYVAPNGSDAGDGSAHHPWATIQHAANLVRPGDVVMVRDGTYNETVAITHGGLPEHPVKFAAEHRWRARIEPLSTVGNSNYSIYFSHADYVTVEGFEITGTPTTSAAIKFDSGTHNSVIGNNIHDVGVSMVSCTGGGAILIADSFNRIEGNLIWNISPPRTAPFRCNQQHGIYLAAGAGGWIQNNVIYHVWQGVGLHIHGRELSGWSITNNTVYDVGDNRHNTGGPMIFQCLAGTCDHNKFNNNIFARTEGGYCWWEVQNPAARLGIHNEYRNNITYECGSEIWVTGRVDQSLYENPRFVSSGTGDFHLSAESPARCRGTASDAPTKDFEGRERSPGCIDIGAFQRSGSERF